MCRFVVCRDCQAPSERKAAAAGKGQRSVAWLLTQQYVTLLTKVGIGKTVKYVWKSFKRVWKPFKRLCALGFFYSPFYQDDHIYVSQWYAFAVLKLSTMFGDICCATKRCKFLNVLISTYRGWVLSFLAESWRLKNVNASDENCLEFVILCSDRSWGPNDSKAYRGVMMYTVFFKFFYCQQGRKGPMGAPGRTGPPGNPVSHASPPPPPPP